jgi:hypothetical protein
VCCVRYENITHVVDTLGDSTHLRHRRISNLRNTITHHLQDCFHHEGNIRFRALIETMLSQYTMSRSKKHKMQIIQFVVETVLRGGGRFLKKENRRWYDGGIACGKDKVSFPVCGCVRECDWVHMHPRCITPTGIQHQHPFVAPL